MSYDITLKVSTGGDEPAYLWDALDANYTYNVSPMLREALGSAGINGLEDKPGSEAGPILRAGIAAMEANPQKFRALNPSNGWGNYEGCLQWLHTIANACEAHPDALVSVQ